MLFVSDIDKPDNLVDADIFSFERCLYGGCELRNIKEFFENIHLMFTNQTLDSDSFNNLIKSHKKDWKEYHDGYLTQIQKFFIPMTQIAIL
ncbi:hypothetical protein AGMMS49921_01110 [Endomicrobiia bacterium]|nr:hypothetical protein AGMMS49921_01110 [Endomicrobiia bacterium]